MNTNSTVVNLDALAQSFEKIYKGLDKKKVARIEEELTKIVPSSQSLVTMTSGYDETDNMILLDIFVSNPQSPNTLNEIRFDKVMRSMLEKADINKLPIVMKCMERMEGKKNGSYDIDGTEVSYNDELAEYYFHLVIWKN